MEVTIAAEGEMVQNLYFPQDDPSIHPSINSVSLSTPVGSFYVVFGVVTALNMGAMQWNVSLLYTKDHLYYMVCTRHQGG